ncbi:MAG: hydrogenase expression/formation protein HypE [Epsilonproteobacteria bacterium]|uniref:hydrogenase expression/formation protein HypE n=1 Tax=Sulfurospirillum sp. hDNRA2 TaxID=3237298 RepID=UPI0020B7797C|nr:hydrogenase expression/formation protein HypE [Sulfurospirillum sp. DNRA8]MCR1809961.1 hydrogenase expression/formation protein HypE [Sulfurospirillum sp. DNRA8]MDY0265862.1 hydrogenase expression/formation protein HypE [Sulfurospirillum cavolei]NCB54874.1 hydrogenase expression/formation protein HypE [Campylobacterota bacterium]
MSAKILLSHGGGGEETQSLIKNLFFKHFGNDILLRMEDAAVLTMKSEKIAFTTDSFTVSPLFFKGGNIGKLAIAGTVNDLSMMGARPKYLTCAFMIEEGFEYEKLEEIVISMRDEMAKSGVKIVAGDTKVVPKGGVDGVFINTAGVGEVLKEGISAHALRQGDAIIVTNEVGNHGACILAMREELELQSDLKTDCASLWKSVEALIDADIEIHALRDATRGGVSAVLNEWAQTSNVGIHVREADIPVANEVKGMCELLGFEPYEFANEGTMLIALPQSEVAKALEVLKRFEETSKSTLIGDVDDRFEGRVVLQTPWDSERFLEPPKGELLPRIC